MLSRFTPARLKPASRSTVHSPGIRLNGSLAARRQIERLSRRRQNRRHLLGGHQAGRAASEEDAVDRAAALHPNLGNN